MEDHFAREWDAMKRVKERNRIGVWGFGSVSRDVIIYLIDERMGQEIVFYGRPKEGLPNRAARWVDDLKANATRRPRIMGTNRSEDMADLDVIFIGVGVPRNEGQTRRDLLSVNTEVIAKTSLKIKEAYKDCPEEDLPILIYLGNPVTTMTWVGYKVTGFPRSKVMGQAGNLDARRICHAVSQEMGLSGNDMQGIVFGDHGDSMVVSPRYFSVGGVPLDVLVQTEKVREERISEIIEDAKKGGTHFVNETGHSASVGPAKAVGEMLRCIISGEPEVQPVVAIVEHEYGLLKKEHGVDSFGFGVPAKISSYGVEKIYELPVDDIRDALEHSAAPIIEDTRAAAQTLSEKFGL
jgi:malate dehydrogenase